MVPQHERLVLAYEPTGHRHGPDGVAPAGAGGRTHCQVVHPTRVLYGGSVKPTTPLSCLAQPDVDGALVGGASLDPNSFTAICLAARSRARSKN